MSDAVMVSAGSAHSCAVRESGAVECWGAGWSGRLGNGNAWSTTPQDIVWPVP